MRIPTVGDKIYLNSAYFLSHGADDFEGGLATIIKVEMHKSAGEEVFFIRCKENPSCSYNWKILSEEQEELKKEFGKKKAHPVPDLREEFNRWD